MLAITAALTASLAAQLPDLSQPAADAADSVPARAPLAARFYHQSRIGSAFGAAWGSPSTDQPRPPADTVEATRDWIRPFTSRWELQDTVRRKRGSVTVSEGYATRLKIHQIGAIVLLPLVATEFVLGQSMINDEDRSSSIRTAHKVTALAIGTVVGVNTITGALNWWETRKNPDGRTRRTLHALLMLASDVGFVATALAAGGAKDDIGGARHHRALAEISISVSVASALMMWLWKG